MTPIPDQVVQDEGGPDSTKRIVSIEEVGPAPNVDLATVLPGFSVDA
jgi:hypothetical protein